MENLTGKTLGRYQLTRLIGRGGMSTVYLARDPSLDREVAIKVLPPQLAWDQEFSARFEREAMSAARLRHPNIVTIFDVGEWDGLHCIVMEYLGGEDLGQLLHRQGPLPPKEVSRILQAIASALDYAHAQGVIHRDVKPGNIFIGQDGRVTLGDFGIARPSSTRSLTATGAIIGTPEYMAPEQIMGEGEIDSRSDQFSLAVVAYQMLSGNMPFAGGDSPMQVFYNLVNSAPIPISEVQPNLPSSTAAVLNRALSKQPDQRYPTVMAFVEALNATLQGIEAPIPMPDVVHEPPGSPSTGVSRPAPQASEYAPPQVGPRPKASARPSWLSRIANFAHSLFSKKRPVTTRIQSYSNPATQPRHAPSIEPSTIYPSPAQSTYPAESPTTPPAMPVVPPTVSQRSQPSLILRPQVAQLLDPLRDHALRELLSQQDAERLINFVVTYKSARYLLTGYDSFGGTTLTREIVKSVQDKLSPWGILLAVRFERVESLEDNPMFQVYFQLPDGDHQITVVAPTPDPNHKGEVYGIRDFLDTLGDHLSGQAERSSLRKAMDEALRTVSTSPRVILVLDAVRTPETLNLFLDHPLLETQQAALLAVVERETYNRWDDGAKKFFRNKRALKEWYVNCLWEADYGLVKQTLSLLFSGYQVSSPEIQQLQEAFGKHIAFIGRGIVGRMIRELQETRRYWELDPTTKQAFIAFDGLDKGWIENNAWLQDTLDQNWDNILGRNFPRRELEDRAKQGVYTLVDWIVEHATFNREDILEAAEHMPIFISPYGRLRNEVVSRLLQVLVDNGYLQVVEDEYGIIWGMDVTPSGVALSRGEDEAPSDVVRKSLERYLADLLEEYEAVHDQISTSLEEVERTRLNRRADKLEQDIEAIRQKLEIRASMQSSET